MSPIRPLRPILFGLALFTALTASAAVSIFKDAAGPTGNLTDSFAVPSAFGIRYKSGSTLQLDDGTVFTIGTTASADFRTAIGAGTSSFSGAWASLTGKPTTLAGAGITGGANLDAIGAQAASYYLGRANHTGTQLAATISDFTSAATAAAPVQSVASRTGVVTLTKTDVGLANVDNTSDVNKPVSTAQAAADALALAKASNLSDLASATSARTNLGLGSLATQSGTFSGTSSGTNTGDQTITLTGDVTGSGPGSFAATIGAGAVTLAKQANMATASVVYRKTAGSGAPEVNTLATLKTDLGLTGTNSGDQTITLTGGVTGSGSGSFAATVVTNANLTGDVTSVGNAATLANVPSGTPHAGSSLFTAITAPSTPASGKGSVYVDSTSKNIAVKDDAGVVKHGVQTAAAVAGKGVTAINDAGAVTLDALYPIGTVLPTAPSDGGTWLQMNGQVVTQSTYATLFAIIGHRPEFTWSMSVSTAMGATAVQQVAFGGSKYVAVGAFGAYYSSDLITWTLGNATSFNSVAYGAGVFVAVGVSNAIYSSSDGITWTSRTSGVTSTLATVVFYNSLFVAVGSSGWITSSSDGTTWTATQPNSGPSLAFILYNSSLGLWLTSPTSVGSSTNLAYSSNGTAWTTLAKPTANNYVVLGFDNSYFYVADTGSAAGATHIWRSANGSAWTDMGSFKFGLPSFGTNCLVFSGGVIAMPLIGYTSDGFTTIKQCAWPVEHLITTNPQILTDPHGQTQKFALLGSGNGGAIFATVDGKTFTPCSNSPAPGGQNNSSFVARSYYVNGNYFYLPNSGGQGTSNLFYAPDPYAPATQFQIPTRNDASGTALYIKAL